MHTVEQPEVLLFGGTYDPFTLGHEDLVQRLRHNFPNSKIYVAPAGDPKHKSREGMATFDHRLNMTRLALREAGLLDDGRVIVSEIERELSGSTIDTIKAIEEIENALTQLVIGGDWVRTFETWVEARDILTRGVWVVQRLTEEIQESDLLHGMNLIPGNPIHGYSGAPRALRDKNELLQWVRPSVADYMEREKLHAFAN